MKEFKIKVGDDKPHLLALMDNDPQKAMKVIGTFVELMEEAVENHWHQIPQLFHRDLTFAQLVKGVLHGSLDLPEMNPETFDVLREEVHPLSMLTARKDYMTGGLRYTDWRKHFQLPESASVDQNTVATIIRKLLRYGKYINVEKLAQYLNNNQAVTYRGLGEPNIENLPFVPALRYQQHQFGDLHVGKFFDEIGAFDCGVWMDGDSTDCSACLRPDLHQVGIYHICLACNAGWKEEAI